ncbi:MAG TPA: hypothetical protein VGR35_17880 [Tepidisphaeraceae bacterium]|nr:hypothetical protein [Tepidisphaeraceae bacterium]
MRHSQLVPLALLYVASAWLVFVAVRIEILNARSGYFLPNTATMAESKRHGGSGAWRAVWMDEQRWRSWYVRDENGQPDPRPLTAAEELQMRRDIEKQNANYRLRSFVTVFGTLQYPILFVTAAIGTKLALSERRRKLAMVAYWLPVAVAVLAGGLAFYRGYFTSGID